MLRRKVFDESLWRSIRGRGLMSWPDVPIVPSNAPQEKVFEHPFFDFRVWLDTSVGPRLYTLIVSGDYELMDLDLFDRYLVPGERVLNIGGGIGVAGSFCALKVKTPVVVVEANHALHRLIHKQAEVNDVEIKIIHAACVPDHFVESTVPFNFHEEFWFSTLVAANTTYSRQERVPAEPVSKLVLESKADVLVMDIEGAEVQVLSASIAPQVQKLFVEIHAPDLGEMLTSQFLSSIFSQGFHMVDFRGRMFYFQRNKTA